MNVVRTGILVVALLSTHTASASFWGKVKNAFNDCKYSEEEYKEVYAIEKAETRKLPEHFSGKFSEADFVEKPWMRDFQYVIVVNKSAKGPMAQTMRLYENGLLVHQTKVSTGREGLELRRKNKVCTGAPPKSYWSQTPTGYYTPKYLSKDHRSSSWDSDMPNAIFYDLDNGLALHEVHPSYEKYLGGRASGGCVRQDKGTAEELFNRVASTEGASIPEINLDGTPVLDEQGNVKYINQQFWVNPYTGKTAKFNTFSALIIVEAN